MLVHQTTAVPADSLWLYSGSISIQQALLAPICHMKLLILITIWMIAGGPQAQISGNKSCTCGRCIQCSCYTNFLVTPNCNGTVSLFVTLHVDMDYRLHSQSREQLADDSRSWHLSQGVARICLYSRCFWFLEWMGLQAQEVRLIAICKYLMIKSYYQRSCYNRFLNFWCVVRNKIILLAKSTRSDSRVLLLSIVWQHHELLMYHNIHLYFAYWVVASIQRAEASSLSASAHHVSIELGLHHSCFAWQYFWASNVPKWSLPLQGYIYDKKRISCMIFSS